MGRWRPGLAEGNRNAHGCVQWQHRPMGGSSSSPTPRAATMTAATAAAVAMATVAATAGVRPTRASAADRATSAPARPTATARLTARVRNSRCAWPCPADQVC